MKNTTSKNTSLKETTSWNEVGKWYDSIVGSGGHYYHTHVILPGVTRLLSLKDDSRLLDIACGQAVLARCIPKTVSYVGIDLAKELISQAKKYKTQHCDHQFLVGDATKPLPLPEQMLFSHAAIILALQNISSFEKVFYNVAKHLQPDAHFVLVLNHPAFRIPRQSSWGFDDHSKTQYRKLNGYMTPQKIPIIANPGAAQSERKQNTWSFHAPLSAYITGLANAGFVVDALEEWCSDKVSTGKAKAWENRARKEFPLFLAIRARYIKANTATTKL